MRKSERKFNIIKNILRRTEQQKCGGKKIEEKRTEKREKKKKDRGLSTADTNKDSQPLLVLFFLKDNSKAKQKLFVVVPVVLDGCHQC